MHPQCFVHEQFPVRTIRIWIIIIEINIKGCQISDLLFSSESGENLKSKYLGILGSNEILYCVSNLANIAINTWCFWYFHTNINDDDCKEGSPETSIPIILGYWSYGIHPWFFMTGAACCNREDCMYELMVQGRASWLLSFSAGLTDPMHMPHFLDCTTSSSGTGAQFSVPQQGTV